MALSQAQRHYGKGLPGTFEKNMMNFFLRFVALSLGLVLGYRQLVPLALRLVIGTGGM